MVSNWEPAHSLVEDAVSPLCLYPAGKGLERSQPALLYYSLTPLLCEWARLWVRLENFTGKFYLSFFLFGYPIVWVAISCYLPQIVLRAFRPGPYPKNATLISLSSPRLLVREASIWGSSPLGVVVRRLFYGLFVFSLFCLCCPLIPNSPQILQ